MKKMKSWLLGVGLLLTNMTFGQTIQEGLRHMERHHPRKAKQVFDSLAVNQPSGENYFYLGYFYLNQRQWDNARKAFETGMSLEPKQTKGLYLNQVGLASILVGQNKVDEAKPLFNKILDETKNRDVDVMFRIAEAYTMYYNTGKDNTLNSSNIDPAETLRLIEAIETRLIKEKKKLSADHYILRGDAYLTKNDAGSAATAYDNAIREDPRNLKAKIKIASLLHSGKNYNLAQQRYKEILDEDSTYSPALQKYGKFLTVGKQYKNSSRYFKKYLDYAEVTPSSLIETAKNLFLAQDYEGAMKYTDEAEKLGVKDADIFRMRGYSYIEFKDYQKGIDNLVSMVNTGVNPFYQDDIYFARGYQGLGKDSLAIMYYERAAPLDTNNNIYSTVHDILFKQKRYLDAVNVGYKSINWKQARKQVVGSGDFDKVAFDYYLVAARTPKTDSLKRVSFAFLADSLSSKAISINDKFPPFYIRRARINSLFDFSKPRWLSIPYYEKYVEVAQKLKEENAANYKEDKNLLFEAYKAIGGYYLEEKKDKDKALPFFEKAKSIKSDDTEVNDFFNRDGKINTPGPPSTTSPKK